MSLERRAALFGWIFSVFLHASVVGYVAWRTSTPDLGFSFELPMEVEFGLSESVTVSMGAASQPPSVPVAVPSVSSGEGAMVADAGVPEGSSEGGVHEDAGRRRRRDRDAGAPRVAEGQGEEGDGAGDEREGGGVAFLPAGSQIALRLDVERMRSSPLAPDIRNVLSSVPDWQALIEGSGIDPLEDLDRLLVATPNLDRSRLIAAGRAQGDETSIRVAAARMAAAAEAGEPAWRALDGVPVTDWRNRDPTERMVALVGPRHFVIARAEDLPRVLGVARARAASETEDVHPAEALLSMQEGEGLSLEVEGFRNYARARPGARQSPADVLPVRMRLGMSDLAQGRIGARVRGHFDSAQQASGAVAYWDEARQAYARNVITAVLGLSPILSRLTLRAEGEVMHASVDIELTEMRRVLNLVRSYFEDRARGQQGTPVPASPPGAPLIRSTVPSAPTPSEPLPLPASPY